MTFVVIPLYGTKRGEKYIPEKSGLNQWLAAGRARRFGECYFPVPSAVHKKAPSFFPELNRAFPLVLPNGIVSNAKLCQAGKKALMTSPNHHLGIWLFDAIDGSSEIQKKRLLESLPYAYSDLLRLGFDSVVLEFVNERFQMTKGRIGLYEDWIAGGVSNS